MNLPSSSLPQIIRAEVKFTTGRSITLTKRERESLVSHNASILGIVAALFCGRHSTADGRWLIADPNDYWGRIGNSRLSLTSEDLVRTELAQPSLEWMRVHVAARWKGFLHASLEHALKGLQPLKEELEVHFKSGLLFRPLPDDVLDLDHRDALSAIICTHGESVAGQIFQALFSYLLGSAGYDAVNINAVGVPDIELSVVTGATGNKQAEDLDVA